MHLIAADLSIILNLSLSFTLPNCLSKDSRNIHNFYEEVYERFFRSVFGHFSKLKTINVKAILEQLQHAFFLVLLIFLFSEWKFFKFFKRINEIRNWQILIKFWISIFWYSKLKKNSEKKTDIFLSQISYFHTCRTCIHIPALNHILPYPNPMWIYKLFCF